MKLHKKLNPYLYPFKMKPPDDILYPQIDFQTPMAKILNKNTLNLFQIDTQKDWFLCSQQEIFSVLKEPNDMIKTTAIIFTRPKYMRVAFESSNSAIKPHSETVEEIKSSTAAKDIPRVSPVTLEGPNPINLPCARPKPRYMVLERPKYKDIIHGRPILQDVSMTKTDRVQKGLESIPTNLKVGLGVLSGMVATTAVHPLDVIKVRLQLFPKKIATLHMLHRIMMCEGYKSLYAGLTAGLLRQLTYTGTRLFVYNSLYDVYKEEYGGNPGFSEQLYIAVIAGLAGAFMGTPSEMALVRLIEVRRLRRSSCSPPCSMACKHVRKPKGVFYQLYRIARREGIAMWWRGGVPTLLRSVFVSSAQVGVYSQVRELVTDNKYLDSSIKLHFFTAIFSSFVTAVLSLPIDQVKTRYQSFQERDRTCKEIFTEMLRKKGVRYLWKGFTPYYIRQIIHTVITYVVLDELVHKYVEFQEAALHPK